MIYPARVDKHITAFAFRLHRAVCRRSRTVDVYAALLLRYATTTYTHWLRTSLPHRTPHRTRLPPAFTSLSRLSRTPPTPPPPSYGQ